MKFKTQPQLYTSGDIKREAKAQLDGHWKQAIILCLIPGLITILLGWNTVEGNESTSFLADIILGFFATGALFALLDLFRNSHYHIDPLRDIIQTFKRKYFLNLLLLKLLQTLYIFLWTLLFIIPGIIKIYAYSQAEFIYKDIVDKTGEQPSPGFCLKESEKLMKGYKAELFLLELSFIGWYIASAFTLGLLYLWVNPYVQMSRVVFYEKVSNNKYRGLLTDENTYSTNNAFYEQYEEVGKDPNDFRDFDDF